MAAAGPADREERGEAGEAVSARAPFDLGDSRDLAAAVRAAYGQDQAGVAPPRPDVPRPVIAPRGRLPLPMARPRASTLLAGVGALAALAATAAIPIMGRGIEPAPRAAEPRAVRTTATTRDVTPTTAFTYRPETILGPTTTVAPVPPAPAVASPPSPAQESVTPTTSRPRSTATTRAAPRTTQAPTTTTQPPPPDDGGGSNEPPPYP